MHVVYVASQMFTTHFKGLKKTHAQTCFIKIRCHLIAKTQQEI